MLTWAGGGYFFNGQWRAVIKNEYMITCGQCKIVLAVLRANEMVPMFDSDQHQMAIELERLLK
jgi:hypothetical protein